MPWLYFTPRLLCGNSADPGRALPGAGGVRTPADLLASYCCMSCIHVFAVISTKYFYYHRFLKQSIRKWEIVLFVTASQHFDSQPVTVRKMISSFCLWGNCVNHSSILSVYSLGFLSTHLKCKNNVVNLTRIMLLLYYTTRISLWYNLNSSRCSSLEKE